LGPGTLQSIIQAQHQDVKDHLPDVRFQTGVEQTHPMVPSRIFESAVTPAGCARRAAFIQDGRDALGRLAFEIQSGHGVMVGDVHEPVRRKRKRAQAPLPAHIDRPIRLDEIFLRGGVEAG